jgi:hypothetical protein
MAIYHLSVKPVSRSAGRSATAAAAYRAGVAVHCEREGRLHDYTRKQGIAHSEILVPSGAIWARDRSSLWNAAEAAEKRSNSTVAREYELALPAELSASSRVELARAFGAELIERYGVAVDIAIHAPHRDGDRRNWHAHVLTTTRKIEEDGFGAKTRILDDRKTGPAEVVELRALWAELSNSFLEREGTPERVDHRSLEAIHAARREEGREHLDAGRVEEAKAAFAGAVEVDRPAQVHMGPAASAIERKTEREALVSGRDYEPATRIGAEVLRARQVRAAMQDYLRAWVGAARAHVESLSERLEAAFSKVKERFAGQERGTGREGEGKRDAAPDQSAKARSFLARRDGAEDLARPAPAVDDAQRGSFLDRRAQGLGQERSGDRPDAARAPSRADIMESARRGLSETLAQIGGLLPEGPMREEFESRARVLLERADEAAQAQRRVEQMSRAERPQPAKELSEVERQCQIDLENAERIAREIPQRDRSRGEGQER